MTESEKEVQDKRIQHPLVAEISSGNDDHDRMSVDRYIRIFLTWSRRLKMKSEWKVTSNYEDGAIIYQGYRLKDVDDIDDADNREYDHYIYGSYKEAGNRAKYLNMLRDFGGD